MQIEQLFQKAQQLHQQGQLAQAEQWYEQVVHHAPHFAEAKHLLGIVCSQQGKHQAGIQWILKAIQQQPAQPGYYNNMGLIYARIAQWQAATAAYRAALKLAPRFAEAWFNLANAVKAQGKLEEAIRYYQKTLKLAPRHVKAMYNLGNTFLETGKAKSARHWLEQAIQIRPDYAEAHNNLGSALDAWQEFDRALHHYQQAIKIRPDFPDAIKNLGLAHARRGDYEKARSKLQAYHALSISDNWGDLALASISPIIFADNTAIDSYRDELRKTLATYRHRSLSINLANLHQLNLEPPANLPYQGRPDLEIKNIYGQLFDRHLPIVKRQTTISNPKPHIGFVVTNGHEGVFLKCMAGILNQLDTGRFSITVVCSLPNGPQIIQPQIQNAQVRYLGLPKALDQALETMASAQFDLLHYWEVGTDYQNYFLPFFRLAPVQCTSWGWPVTSGIPQMDFFLSSELLEIPEADDHYTEHLVRFKKLPTYYYRPPIPGKLEGIENFGLPGNVPTYLCAQNLRKIHPDFDQLVKAILEQDPIGQILFIKDAQPNITRLLQDRLTNTCGQHTARIHFLDRMPAERYLNLVAVVDVILDTLYYTGGANTAYDAIAAGTPFVTLPWNYHRGRFGAAAYRQIGVEVAIATDTADYVAKAVHIANDKIYRKALSDRISANAHLVFQDIEAVQELEFFFTQHTYDRA